MLTCGERRESRASGTTRLFSVPSRQRYVDLNPRNPCIVTGAHGHSRPSYWPGSSLSRRNCRCSIRARCTARWSRELRPSRMVPLIAARFTPIRTRGLTTTVQRAAAWETAVQAVSRSGFRLPNGDSSSNCRTTPEVLISRPTKRDVPQHPSFSRTRTDHLESPFSPRSPA
jgi:hypothetical protein